MEIQKVISKVKRTVDDSLLALHDQRRQIVGEKNPLERQRLMRAHREEMYQHMLITRASGTLGQNAIGSEYGQKYNNDFE